jgi:hypothetical protein
VAWTVEWFQLEKGRWALRISERGRALSASEMPSKALEEINGDTVVLGKINGSTVDGRHGVRQAASSRSTALTICSSNITDIIPLTTGTGPE